MPGKRILILGGTRDARALAADLIARGLPVITSLAGVTAEPLLPPGEVRRGGFGGAGEHPHAGQGAGAQFGGHRRPDAVVAAELVSDADDNGAGHRRVTFTVRKWVAHEMHGS